jgi:hypothetical protein
VRRFEKLTLLPNVFALPHTSHCPATTGLPSIVDSALEQGVLPVSDLGHLMCQA